MVKSFSKKSDWYKSTDERVYLSHDEAQKVVAGEISEVYVEILPSGTKFKAGESISLVISNKDLKGAGDVAHVNINKGKTYIYILVDNISHTWKFQC